MSSSNSSIAHSLSPTKEALSSSTYPLPPRAPTPAVKTPLPLRGHGFSGAVNRPQVPPRRSPATSGTLGTNSISKSSSADSLSQNQADGSSSRQIQHSASGSSVGPSPGVPPRPSRVVNPKSATIGPIPHPQPTKSATQPPPTSSSTSPRRNVLPVPPIKGATHAVNQFSVVSDVKAQTMRENPQIGRLEGEAVGDRGSLDSSLLDLTKSRSPGNLQPDSPQILKPNADKPLSPRQNQTPVSPRPNPGPPLTPRPNQGAPLSPRQADTAPLSPRASPAAQSASPRGVPPNTPAAPLSPRDSPSNTSAAPLSPRSLPSNTPAAPLSPRDSPSNTSTPLSPPPQRRIPPKPPAPANTEHQTNSQRSPQGSSPSTSPASPRQALKTRSPTVSPSGSPAVSPPMLPRKTHVGPAPNLRPSSDSAMVEPTSPPTSPRSQHTRRKELVSTVASTIRLVPRRDPSQASWRKASPQSASRRAITMADIRQALQPVIGEKGSQIIYDRHVVRANSKLGNNENSDPPLPGIAEISKDQLVQDAEEKRRSATSPPLIAQSQMHRRVVQQKRETGSDIQNQSDESQLDDEETKRRSQTDTPARKKLREELSLTEILGIAPGVNRQQRFGTIRPRSFVLVEEKARRQPSIMSSHRASVRMEDNEENVAVADENVPEEDAAVDSEPLPQYLEVSSPTEVQQAAPQIKTVVLPRVAYNICVLGGQQGKSSYLYRYLENDFISEGFPTIEYTYYKTISFDGEECALSLLDTSGDDIYVYLRPNWFKFGEGFIFLLNVMSNISRTEVLMFYKQVVKAIGPNFPRIIVATAADRTDARVVTVEQLRELAIELGCNYFEVSALNGQNIDKSIRGLIKEMKYRRLDLSLSSQKNQNNSKIIEPILPSFLENRNQTYLTSHLMGGNYTSYLVSSYKNIGTLMIHRYDGKQLTYYDNPSVSTISTAEPPIIASLHKDMSMQVINMDSHSCETFPVDESFKDVQCILFDDKHLLLISTKRIFFVEGGPESWHRNCSNGKAIPFEGSRPLQGVNQEMSSLMSSTNDKSGKIGTSRVLLVGSFSFQVWDLHLSTLTAVLIAEGDSGSSTESFLGVQCHTCAIFARTLSKASVWNFEADGTISSIQASVEPETLITCAFLESACYITGDNRGILSVRKYSEEKASRNLNAKPSVPQKSKASRNEYQMEGDATFQRVGFDLAYRVNCIKKTGRLIWVGVANCSVAVYDFFQANANPLAEVSAERMIPKSILVEQDLILFKMQQNLKAKKKDKPKEQQQQGGSTLVFSWFPQI
eukprot:TRINITY_DN3663_c0_g1_i1.p1 TRINITY_DN3663_c0_g1~~TRINITY_DN3663_c0_g1_i1.p1  ORF type:complete len:1285 (-),score=268.60 TRINITY_DN3663_c0_g1_i1:39-3893(-)